MEPSGIAALGIDAKVLVTQAINFVILLIILKLFAYGPIMAMLDRRQKKVAEGVKAAEDAEALKAEMTQKQEVLLRNARAEARQILTEAKDEAELEHDKARDKLQKELALSTAEHAEQLKIQTARAKKALKSELGTVVVRATEKVVGKTVDEKWTERAAHDAVEELA